MNHAESAASSSGPVVVITGASAGVGRATAIRFAREGAKIGLLARGRAGLEGAKADVERAGGQAIVIPTDVADADAVEAAAAQVEATFGPIDVWIGVAMASVFSPVKEMLAAEYQRVTEVTYLGQVYGAQSALKRMLPRDKGAILLVGSALAYRGIPLQSAYCGAKHAMQGFADSLRTELLHDKSNVTLTMIQMPALNTPQFGWVKSRLPKKAQPVPPIFQPEVAAEAIFFSWKNPRRELLVAFPTYEAVLGNKAAPEFADWFLARTGFSSQQTDEPEDPNRPDNLYHPVDDAVDYGAHGTFDAQAKETSLMLEATMNRNAVGVAAGIGALAIAAGGLLLWNRRGGNS
jgi:NAD(P)-dependent dehydrogenase (short-subunit alcohol dehydrogenase family)